MRWGCKIPHAHYGAVSKNMTSPTPPMPDPWCTGRYRRHIRHRRPFGALRGSSLRADMRRTSAGGSTRILKRFCSICVLLTTQKGGYLPDSYRNPRMLTLFPWLFKIFLKIRCLVLKLISAFATKLRRYVAQQR